MRYSKINPKHMPEAEQLGRKAQAMAANISVGQEMRVQIDKHYTKVGNVVRAEVDRICYTASGRSLQAVFKVTLLCGINKVEREVFVTRIPTN